MSKESQPSTNPRIHWTIRKVCLVALVWLLAGFVLGYQFRGSTGKMVPLSANALSRAAAPMLAALRADPNNVETLMQLGNFYYDHYDHQLYQKATEYYGRALELRPNDMNVRTDLGTAYWYSGLPEKAVTEYEKSLALDPTDANTLFNLGVVRLEGLKDAKGAIAAWEKLLATNPQAQQRQQAMELIAKARAQTR